MSACYAAFRRYMPRAENLAIKGNRRAGNGDQISIAKNGSGAGVFESLALGKESRTSRFFCELRELLAFAVRYFPFVRTCFAIALITASQYSRAPNQPHLRRSLVRSFRAPLLQSEDRRRC